MLFNQVLVNINAIIIVYNLVNNNVLIKHANILFTVNDMFVHLNIHYLHIWYFYYCFKSMHGHLSTAVYAVVFQMLAIFYSPATTSDWISYYCMYAFAMHNYILWNKIRLLPSSNHFFIESCLYVSSIIQISNNNSLYCQTLWQRPIAHPLSIINFETVNGIGTINCWI